MPHLYYVHDPMCSWCWAFRPTLAELLSRLPAGMSHSRLLGGLAPDSDQPMPSAMREQLQATWRRIQAKLPATDFNFDFWTCNTPRRSTYPACRAVIAARSLDESMDEAMTLAIQQAYYLQARNPSDDITLIELAGELGLDRELFGERLNSPQTQQQLAAEIDQTARMGARSFPSLVLQDRQGFWPLAVDYQSADVILDSLHMILGPVNTHPIGSGLT
jgi:putative protein-disulfide isomerase